MMKILKASAGSGKTFSLTREYIKMLLSSDKPDAYRHILAVTFTNKATDEMKRRILKELYTLAVTPEKSPYISDIVPEIMSTRAEAKNKAERMLTLILHDYGSFAVSTIDKFFQQALRAFSREIGQFNAYQVELDKDSLVDETVERVLDGLSERNRPLLDWIIRGVRADLESTGRFTLDRRLREMAASVVSEGSRDIAGDKESLMELNTTCESVIDGFIASVSAAARDIVRGLEESGINAADTNRGFLKAVYNYLEPSARELLAAPTASFMDKASDPEKWFAKTKSSLIPLATDYLYGPITAFTELFGAKYKEYATAVILRQQIYGLGLAGELRKAFVEVQKERGVISIDDTNAILHDIIDGTDTPFLYEKLGVRFEDFLLDEFQDTSGVQWENFLPLLQNSDAEGNENLVVGDVKQSIYRWRGSQWDLLDSRLQKQFHVPADQISVLDGNYRTCKSVVSFNNDFFPFAAAELDRLVGNSPTSPFSVRSIYGDVVQEIRTKDGAKGSVSVRYVDNADAETDEVVASIKEAVGRGARYNDIAILVRGNAEGALLAQRFVAEGIPVMSDDSLFVKSSVTVRRLVSQLSIVDNPSRADGNSVAGYMAREMSISAPAQYHCLTDLAEGLLSEIKAAAPQQFDSEAPFVNGFMDWLQEWTRKNGNNLGAMLRDWEEATPKIASPEGSTAVRIMTVHKSKGLEFPYVIFPFAEKVGLYKPESYWCRPEVGGTALERVGGQRFRASLSDASLNTLFEEDYVRERSQQAVDNINVFYVALTRAKCELKIISAKPPKAVVDAVANGSPVPAKSLSHLLYAYTGGADYDSGELYDYTRMERSNTGPKPLVLKYACSSSDSEQRLCFRTKPLAESEAPADASDVSAGNVPQADIIEPTLF